MSKPQRAPRRKAGNAEKTSVEAKLQEEFEGLKAKLGIGRDLRLVWMPNAAKGLSGEIKNGVLYVYDEKLDDALKTVRHELLDLVITSRLVEPLVDLINLLIKSREAEVYRQKERLVEMLSGLLG